MGDGRGAVLFVCWLLNVPATCGCMSGTDLHRQFYVLPHWDRSCKSKSKTVHLTQSQYTDTRTTSPSADPKTPGAWQGSHWNANFLSHWYDSTPKKSRRKRDSNPGSSALEADALTTRPTRRCTRGGRCDKTAWREQGNWTVKHFLQISQSLGPSQTHARQALIAIHDQWTTSLI